MDRLLDEVQMEDGYVKVKVDIIDPKFENSPLPPVSCYDEVADLGDARGKYVQWPRFAIKLLNIETTPQNQDLSQQLEDVTCYEPQVSGLVTLVRFHEEPPAPKLSKAEQKIQNALLKIENERPENIRLWAERLKDLFNGKMSIEINVPKEMYPKTSFDIDVESIEYEGVLQFLANGLLEASFLHWCQMAHWVLFIVSPKERSVWILDTISVKAKKDKDDYPLSRAIESSFGSGLTWTMVQCKQQDGTWECGFMVIWFMVQFVLKKRFRFPNNIWTDTTCVTQEEIDMLVENIMTRFFKSKSVGWLNTP
ncbi:putative papain-like cysteine peptidase superfamily [Helianthus annuus]|nr:putative papain-like cysteine peptidase superfamily [Helianthus annuus]